MILAIDTATQQAGVAVVDEADGRVRAARRARVTTHSEALLPLVKEALDEAGVAPRELKAVACCAGPGSFTGLRIGLATAKGLCLATGRPLVLVSSLQALAARAPVGSLAVACLDAFKGEVYAAFYQAGDPPVLEGEELVLSPEELAGRISQKMGNRTIHLIGDGAAKWEVLRVAGTVHDDAAPPDAVDVARIAAHRVRRGEWDDLASAAPRYIRKSEAEIVAEKKDR